MIATAENSVLPNPRQTQALAANNPESVVVWFQEFAGLVGSPCLCVERNTRRVVAQSHRESMCYAPVAFGRQTSEIRNIEIHLIDGGLLYFLVPVPADDRFVVEGFAKTSRTINPVEFVLASLEAGWQESRIHELLEMAPISMLFPRELLGGWFDLCRSKKSLHCPASLRLRAGRPVPLPLPYTQNPDGVDHSA